MFFLLNWRINGYECHFDGFSTNVLHRHLGTWTKKGTKIGFNHIQPLNKDIRSLRAKSIALYLIKNVSGSPLYLFEGAKSRKNGYCHLGTDFHKSWWEGHKSSDLIDFFTFFDCITLLYTEKCV